MSYREYVENAILESGLEEAADLLEICESAETVDDYEAIEEYLTEKKECGDPYGMPKTSKKLSTNEKLAALGAGTVGPRNPIKNTYKGMRSAVAYKAADKGGAEAFNKAAANFDKGAIAAGATAFLAAVATASLAVRQKIKKANSTPAKVIEKQIKELESQASDIAKKCKAGEITAKEAKVQTKKVQLEIAKLEKAAAKIVKADAASTNESVDITDVQLQIFESFEAGNISEKECDELIALVESV